MKPIIKLWSFLTLIAFFIALSIGETPFDLLWHSLPDRLWQMQSTWHPLIDERLPRALTLLLGGASLAVAGAVMQALFQSPLATPTLLGSSSGGSLFLTIVIALQWPLAFTPMLIIAACLGSLLALYIVYQLWRLGRSQSSSQLLLIGLAVSMLLLAIESCLLYALRGQWQLMQLVQELSAGISYTLGWHEFTLLLPPITIGLFICLYYHREIDLLSLGEEEALSLGVDVPKIRKYLFIAVSLLSGAALATIGNIAFFGMLLPCAIRRLYGPIHRSLLILCILAGGTVLISFDALLRYFAVLDFNITHLSGVIGSLLFLYLVLIPNKRLYNYA